MLLSVRPYVRPSVCSSVAYIANNSRIQRPSVPKFGKKVPHLRCDQTSFEVKRSKVRVTDGREHTVSAEPGGHTVCFSMLGDRPTVHGVSWLLGALRPCRDLGVCLTCLLDNNLVPHRHIADVKAAPHCVKFQIPSVTVHTQSSGITHRSICRATRLSCVAFMTTSTTVARFVST